MSIFEKAKLGIMRSVLDKRKKKNPFDIHFAEHYKLPEDADIYDINSYFFSCHDMQGRSLMLRHAARGGDVTEVWFAYRDEKGNEYINDKQYYDKEPPATSVKCIETDKKWLFSFEGEVRDQKNDKLMDAKFEGTFDATRTLFEFSQHLDSRVLGGAIAKEKWTKDYFKALQKQNQVHYEQPGRLTGTIQIGRKKTMLELNAMRDHSYGRRDWNYMNNHFWLTCLFDDGTTFNANVVSVPAIRSLATGYIEDGNEALGLCRASVDVDIKNYAVPEKFSYTGEFLNGETFKVDCELESVFVFPLDGGKYVIYEGVGTFNMNGKKGRGNLEFGFNGDESRIGKLG